MKRKLKVLFSKICHNSRQNIQLGRDSYLGVKSTILGTHLIIDDYTGIDEIYVVGSQKATIGKYCAIGGNLTIITSNHIINKPNLQAKLQTEAFHDSMDDISKGPVSIGHNVWIGRNVTILPGVSIGHGAIIGAGSVVTKSVDPFAVSVGNPAKTIKKRFSKSTIKKLLSDPWWNWSRKRILRESRFFTTPLS